MNTLIGLLIIAVGSFGQSSSYVPINKVKGWSWENFWLVQGIFAWLVFPLLGALLAIPADGSLIELWGAGGALPAIIYVVRQTDDISRPRLIDGSLALRHKLRRRRETHGLAMTHMQVGRITGELTGTYLAECDT